MKTSLAAIGFLSLSLGMSALVGCASTDGASDEAAGVSNDHFETAATSAASSKHPKAVAACNAARFAGDAKRENILEMQSRLQTWNDCLIAATDAAVPAFKSNAPRNKEPMASAIADVRSAAAATCNEIMNAAGAEGAAERLLCTGSFENLLAVMIDGFANADLGFAAVPVEIGAMSVDHPTCGTQYDGWRKVVATGGMKSVDIPARDAESALSVCLLGDVDQLEPAAANERALTTKLSPSWSAGMDTLCDRFVHDDDVDDESDAANRKRLMAATCHLGVESVLYLELQELLGSN